jgi:ElaB/YqjD/DUF883 family membrane-anchored ribosome-binding protein
MNQRFVPILFVFVFSGCSNAYFKSMEAIGFPKRELLVKRVEAARESQKDAKEQFKTALETFRTVVNVRSGDLETKYEKLKRQLDQSEARASEVRSRIEKVEEVSEALFREWRNELVQYKNPELRRNSEESLADSRARYLTLISAMKRAEGRLEPALQPLRDDVLYLKHNLNAQALSALTRELDEVEGNVDSLVRELEASIAEADSFIRSPSLSR